jgi:Fur family zinc uptake transcriptional regulator
MNPDPAAAKTTTGTPPHTPAGAVLGPFRLRPHDHGKCVADAVAAARALCAERGRRLTELRRRVLELVWGGHEPMGAYDILEELRRERPRAQAPTVYRALEFLMDNGLVHRLQSRNAFVGCGGPGRPHAGQFLICRQCNAVAEMDDPEIAAVLSRNAARAGFRVRRQTVELDGLCAECGEEQGAPA